MREAKEVANKEGVDLTEEDVNTWLRLVEKLDVHSFPSMLQDIKAKRPTEIEIFGKTIVRLGKKHSVPTPINASLVEAIEKLESEF
ncbi:hypothetical protein AGDE_13373 [Angomonas deanei]|nr:hypothetical protein AGDE_13373 [Angomonas deanei]|eukprot:EPY22387.1 hypothetical protein AGDE_13373 [Angomonas deanei]